MNEQPTIALVAGEASGDQLGAALIAALRLRYPQARFAGIGGEKMRAAGLEAWWDCSELALFGLFEVVSHLPRLFRLRTALRQRLLQLRPAVFVGIDAPDFNLGLEAALKSCGIPTVHYVSPTVWAWRPWRVRKIARAADRVLCLFPFEPAFYRDHGVHADYVGHPLAEEIALDSDTGAARRELGLEPGGTVTALLPGSRRSEVARLAGPMLDAAGLLAGEFPGMRFVAAIANPAARQEFGKALGERRAPQVQQVEGRPRTVIAAADVVLCASGTATLETLLVNRPMVMAYRISPATFQLVKHSRIVKRQHFALPNILAGETLVPELIQDEATPERMAAEARRWLQDHAARELLRQRFSALHRELRCDAATRAATAVAELLESRR